MSTTKATAVPAPAATWMLMTGLVFDRRNAWHEMIARDIDLPFSRFRALVRLEQQPLTGRQLAERMGIDAPAASGIVADLVERGLASKTVDPADARAKIVALTDAGRALMDRLREGEAPVPIATALTDAERVQLHALLMKLREEVR